MAATWLSASSPGCFRSHLRRARGDLRTTTSGGPPRRTENRRAPVNTITGWTGTSIRAARARSRRARRASARLAQVVHALPADRDAMLADPHSGSRRFGVDGHYAERSYDDVVDVGTGPAHRDRVQDIPAVRFAVLELTV
jgi:hypothetical protein